MKTRRRKLVGNYSNIARQRAGYGKNNWHVVEEGCIRSAWNSYEEAKEFYDRLCRCFPDVNFDLIQLDNLKGSGLRSETGEFYE